MGKGIVRICRRACSATTGRPSTLPSFIWNLTNAAMSPMVEYAPPGASMGFSSGTRSKFRLFPTARFSSFRIRSMSQVVRRIPIGSRTFFRT